jgi:general secretion pathway protein E
MTQLAYKDYPKEPVVLDSLSTQFMKEALFVPIAIDEGTLKIAIADPDNFYAVDTLRLAYSLNVQTCLGRAEDITDAIDRLYGSGTESMDTIIEEADKNVETLTVYDFDENADHLRDMASEAPIIRLVNRLILNAIEQRASDIHLEPFEKVFKVRYRIDGVLHNMDSPPARLQAAIISRVKIMAKLDIAERRLPQDGRIKLKIADREIDFRVSTLPTLFGESLVMRILDRENLILDFKTIGFPDDVLAGYLDLIRQPYGMILVTGPTGSGKTSTLYATLARINSPENKIIALEDPVEYQLTGINQIQVNAKIGLNFAKGLRSIVRQDPDIILVGEIRDHETAEIAIQSALTGHLLFSTLHTNDAVGAITRLLDMKVESFLLSSTLLGVLAQRLVRVICPACKKEVETEDALMRSLRAGTPELADARFYMGQGCPECRNTGYKGRIAIFEFMRIDEDIRRLIVSHSGTGELRKSALAQGLVTLRQDGWRKVREGITTISEVLKVTLDN